MPAPSGADPSYPDRILAELQKRPMSAIELITALDCEDATHRIYQGAKSLVDKGLIESRNDERDGTRRYFIKGAK